MYVTVCTSVCVRVRMPACRQIDANERVITHVFGVTYAHVHEQAGRQAGSQACSEVGRQLDF